MEKSSGSRAAEGSPSPKALIEAASVGRGALGLELGVGLACVALGRAEVVARCSPEGEGDGTACAGRAGFEEPAPA